MSLVFISCDNKEERFSDKMIEELIVLKENNDIPPPKSLLDIYVLSDNSEIMLTDNYSLYKFYNHYYYKEFKALKEFLNEVLNKDFVIEKKFFKNQFYLKSFKLNRNIETLFKDYTKSLNYIVQLSECRKNDDWDAITSKLDTYLETMNKAEGAQKNKLLINLEFPIDRLIQFITQYNNFINEGEQFYQKFETILNSYENEKQCESKLPLEYKKLKSDIKVAIEKFNVAYRPVEVNGSKMKEILYGINEFQ